ncbi:hypothetical protein Adu01nite_59320 [Paractinoplanes durhamensis]|uniref:Uncharacterized protein n=1 Tax=Paractinoplanes durhamensis TaxID=113563 RepID=A0ABQ3Z450_9ACTN|nr:hypothetical protein Adu01nite_59320 [Actinoplanes durhamensis]
MAHLAGKRMTDPEDAGANYEGITVSSGAASGDSKARSSPFTHRSASELL